MIFNLQDYISLIRDFLDNSISANDFEEQYIALFQENDDPEENEIFEVIEELFFDVDAYTDLPLEEGDDPDDHLNEDQLRASAQKALDQLKAL